ncbi:50S ribosomal protein L3 N(5)-glutamine methyltransferase [Candidatus Blochmannia ocreatus (nom. nud.)]|uniref:50S ribosomal protein L3 N(5)-glutamine methyltransferase n=1 Tax=Candidatus Blochmannia ocreatus (nom. nud.) TaxID=251538 RepID=A0ABY4SSY3_9ENTR|nr:50S ribosomal protein L3 N(5)-glutamine methyltransferase [Candidatus Blochmannia ocreatus]URJ24986.1 50S ribosomal protein L3 N(5)-glutamine methyltransferase [Candidatus Blochmannia ocreatus]
MKNVKTEKLTEIITILDILRWSSSKFNSVPICYGHGTDNFWDETLHLILSGLNLPINIPTEMYHARLTTKERNKLIQLVFRRIIQRVPVPYLVNKAWFCGLEFYVDKRVFIPRSPISELIMSCFHNILPDKPHRILDIGTGSGCISIAIAMTNPNAIIDAVDISIDALKIAEKNIKYYNLENRITPIHSDIFSNILKLKYDLIITNPPYVNSTDIYKLPKEFLYEPIIALSANKKGLSIINKILKNAIHHLNQNGILICEVGVAKTALIEHYPNVPFQWLQFTNGGENVFMLNYEQILSFHYHTFTMRNI